MKKLLYTLLFLLLIGCGSNGQTMADYNQTMYKTAKSEYPEKLTNHFPRELECDSASSKSTKAPSKNDISFLLYEFNLTHSKFDSIKNYCQTKSIAKYESEDSCLLIVNRFKNEIEKNEIIDERLIDRGCYERMFPIPNFINNPMGNFATESKLDSSFSIFVLKSQSGNHFKEYKLSPFRDMPQKWSNGYSKGIAISEKKNIVIYWTVVW